MSSGGMVNSTGISNSLSWMDGHVGAVASVALSNMHANRPSLGTQALPLSSSTIKATPFFANQPPSKAKEHHGAQITTGHFELRRHPQRNQKLLGLDISGAQQNFISFL
jgi:hypothetical protein